MVNTYTCDPVNTVRDKSVSAPSPEAEQSEGRTGSTWKRRNTVATMNDYVILQSSVFGCPLLPLFWIHIAISLLFALGLGRTGIAIPFWA
jgi:hypothetical protein